MEGFFRSAGKWLKRRWSAICDYAAGVAFVGALLLSVAWGALMLLSGYRGRSAAKRAKRDLAALDKMVKEGDGDAIKRDILRRVQ